MFIDVTLIRHGSTEGNHLGKYIGRTDEPLSDAGVKQILTARESARMPFAERVYASNMLRCVQTARLLFPGKEPTLIPDLRECDFGAFEGKTFEELKNTSEYQAWLDSGGTAAFPGGEDPMDFRKRCQQTFLQLCKQITSPSAIAIVCHGGTIMSILEGFSCPQEDFYRWQVKNGEGFRFRFDTQSGLAENIAKII